MQCQCIKSLEAFLEKHHPHVSTTVVSLSLIATLGLIAPSMLLAQTDYPAANYPAYGEGYSPSQPPQPMPALTPTGANPTTSDQPQGSGDQYQSASIPQGVQSEQNMHAEQGNFQNFNGQEQGQVDNQRQPTDLHQGIPSQNMNGEQGSRQQNLQDYNGQDAGQMNEQRAKMEAESLRRMQSGMKGIENGVKSIQNLSARLQKQRLPIPEGLAEKITQINATVAAVKKAKTFEDAQNAGLEELQSLMQDLNDDRMVLEQLSKWPQTLRQADRTVKNFTSIVKKNKSVAARLLKSGFDISDLTINFETAVADLKNSRDKAAELIKTDPEAAYMELEDNFFSQIDDLMQGNQTIQELANLSRFSASFKRSIAEANATIKRLKAKKVDTADLEQTLAAVKEKGNEISSLMKAKPIETDAVIAAFEDLEGFRQDFQAKVGELVGDNDVMPWDGGVTQTKPLDTGLFNQIPNSSGPQGDGTTYQGQRNF